MVAQRNTILSLKMIPGVKAVVFTTDPFWLRYCKKNNLPLPEGFENPDAEHEEIPEEA